FEIPTQDRIIFQNRHGTVPVSYVVPLHQMRQCRTDRTVGIIDRRVDDFCFDQRPPVEAASIHGGNALNCRTMAIEFTKHAQPFWAAIEIDEPHFHTGILRQIPEVCRKNAENKVTAMDKVAKRPAAEIFQRALIAVGTLIPERPPLGWYGMIG